MIEWKLECKCPTTHFVWDCLAQLNRSIGLLSAESGDWDCCNMVNTAIVITSCFIITRTIQMSEVNNYLFIQLNQSQYSS